jgi:hypothetical protein
MKCFNCEMESIYLVDEGNAEPVNYCEACLPPWLTERAHAGQFPLIKPKDAKLTAAPAGDSTESK